MMLDGNRITLVTVLLSLGLASHAFSQQIIIKGGGAINIQGGGRVIINGGGAAGVVVTSTVTPAQEEKAKLPLSPAVEKAFKDLKDLAIPARRKYFEESMAKAVAEVVKISQADEATKAKLEAGAKKAIDLTAAAYLERLETVVGRQIQGPEELALAQIRQLTDYVTSRQPVVGLVPPEEQPVWAETIKASLSAAQFAEWDKIVGVKLRAQEEEITRYLKPNTERMREQFKAGMETETGDIHTVLALPEDRLAKIKTAAEAAVTKSVDSWLEAQVKGIRVLGEADRRQLFTRQGGGYSVGLFKLVRPEQQTVWKDALKDALSADESARLESSRKERAERRNQALALLVISELDKRIGLTASQREQLLPLALKPSRTLIRLNSASEEDEDESNGGVANWYLQQANFIAVAAKLPEAEVRVILDAAQWSRLKDYCKNPPENSYQRQANEGDATEKEADLDGLINDFLHKSARAQEQRMAKNMLVRVEDATRIVSLKPDAVARLSLAARGAVERTMEPWRASLESYLRNNLEGVRAGELRERIAGLGNMSENIMRDKNPQEQPLWKDALKAALTAEENDLWQTELTARGAFRERATTAMALCELDRRRRLSTEQCRKLEPLIAKAVRDYSPDIARYLSNEWQLQSYSLLSPIPALSDAELKDILTPAQMKLVKERDLVQVQGYWEGIKSYHDQRLKGKGRNTESEDGAPLAQ